MADNNSKFRIAVVGIGGVGGFVGGKLAARFENSEDVEVGLLTRGENEKAIRAGGLKLIATEGEQIVKPKLISINEIGNVDLLLLCTKEYDLEETISSLKNFIGEKTIILPLLNGVDTAERIAQILPDTEIWQGCIYIASRLIKPGVVQESGNICLIYFGDGKAKGEKSDFVETLLREAEIDANFAEDIDAKLWEKFVFISALAASTSYFNATIRGVLENRESKALFDELLAEIKRVAAAKKIGISEDAIQERIDKLHGLPPEVTSSMHTDFSSGKRAELQSLVGYVVEQAKELNVPTPAYEKVYGELAKRQKRAAGG